jgi:transketolase
MMADIGSLSLMANRLRIDSIRATTAARSGHPTSCMSCAEIMSCLFFSAMESHDEFVLSKGHAAPILWAAYAECGIIPREDLITLRRIDSVLEGHPTKRMPCVKVATGSLGQGLSAGAGMALGKRLSRVEAMVYVLMGDGECAEGSVWEAVNFAAVSGLSGLCAIVDVNRLGQSQPTMHAHDVAVYKKKFEAFGWDAVVIDGHDVRQVLSAFARAKKSRRPMAIIAKTLKGKGVSFLEDKEGKHGKPLSEDEITQALAEIGPAEIELPSKVGSCEKASGAYAQVRPNKYGMGEMVATREAFGRALVKIGAGNRGVVVIDGDVRNSTKTGMFFDQFPERSFESFIAEQNMVGLAMGLSSQGFTPYLSTFAAFLTRAHDFIRMAQYSDVNIQLVGSHTGVSIGEDGPSQMGLEDISMFLSMSDSVILSPCDAVSAEALAIRMPLFDGVSYMRTIREKTPVIYGGSESFRIGGLKVLRSSKKDSVLVIAHGVAVHEALKAHAALKDKGISVRVIDLYSIRPLDEASIRKNASECGGRVIVVEDHYPAGAGSVIAGLACAKSFIHLCVRGMPRSGRPEELRKMFGIDSAAIIKAVRSIGKKSKA